MAKKATKRGSRADSSKSYGVFEPSAEDRPFESMAEMVHAYNWYNNNKGPNDAREYIRIARPDLKGKLRNVPDYELRTIGWTLRFAQQGFVLTEELLERMNDKLSVLMEKYKPEFKPKKIVENKPTVQDRIREKNSQIIAEIEEEVDRHLRDPKYKFDPYEWMVAKEVNHLAAKAIMDFYKDWDGRDKFVKSIRDAAFKIATNAKIVRKRKRSPNVEKMVQKFQYRNRDDSLQLQSASPADIIGAREVWLYDTEKRVLRVLRGEKLDIRGTTIYGYEETNSFTKKIRKPEETLDNIAAMNKTSLNRIMIKLTTKHQPQLLNGRSNENTIIVKVFK